MLCTTKKQNTGNCIWGYCYRFFPFKFVLWGISLLVRNPCWPIASSKNGTTTPSKITGSTLDKKHQQISTLNSKHHQGRMWFLFRVFVVHLHARSLCQMVATMLDFFLLGTPVFRKRFFDFFRRSNPSKASTFARTFFGSWYHCGTCMLSVWYSQEMTHRKCSSSKA